MSAVLPSPRCRARARVHGVVQGVGFRPYAFRLAEELGLAGHVGNDARGVVCEVEGAPAAVDAFLARLPAETPPLAHVERVLSERVPVLGEASFTILPSAGGRPDALVSADTAPCDECLAELTDPGDRRFRYPFVNCTNCGPRFTIVRGVPYDRALTTMAGFVMCPACQAEYEDPRDRRFHAQPNACPACGPQAQLEGASSPAGTDAVAAAAELLLAGAIVAVKGVGGYHLACRADEEGAVAALRARKHREDKPFALLVPDAAAASAFVDLDEVAAALLSSPERQIVLAPRRPGAPIAASVAPGLTELGVMLPPSPLHHLLAADVGCPLVLTSGNVSDEPIAFADDDARTRLAGIADAFLVHDRPIHMRTDDSVARVVRGRPMLLRRSRGFAPGSEPLPVAARRPLLACGAELKSTFCLARGSRAWVGHHIGDLGNFETLSAFRDGIDHFEALFDVVPEVVAHDLHPDYLSTAYALGREGVERIGVQHHWAHLAACLAEHGETGRAVGAIFDGTGQGADGTSWGGELLVGDLHDYERVGHLMAVPQPGGDRAAREPWRMACAWLERSGVGEDVPAGLRDMVDPERWGVVRQMAHTGFSAPATSSMGRLFDAAAALCGVRSESRYEGQAAIELEALADPGGHGAYPIDVGRDLVLDPRPALDELMEDLSAGTPVGVVSARFHDGVAHATAAGCAAAASAAGLDLVALSGGVFQNRRLLTATASRLEALGLRVLVPSRIPPNDGGIAYGQAAIAAARG